MIIWIICVHGWCRLEHHLKRTASNQFPTLPCWVLLCSASSHGIWESFANGASRGPDIERCFGCVPPEDVVIHVHNTGIYWVCLAIFCKEKQFFFFYVCLLLPLLISGLWANHQLPWTQVSAAALLHARCERRCRELFEIDVKFGNSVAKKVETIWKGRRIIKEIDKSSRTPEMLPVAKYP